MKESIIKGKFKELEKKQLYETFESAYTGLNYVYPDPEMFSFKEIVKNDEVINFFKELCLIANKKANKQNKTFLRISKSYFFKIANKFNYNSKKLYNMFVSSKSHFKNFPILVEIGEEIILCPTTMFLVQGFIYYHLNRDSVNNI